VNKDFIKNNTSLKFSLAPDERTCFLIEFKNGREEIFLSYQNLESLFFSEEITEDNTSEIFKFDMNNEGQREFILTKGFI